MASFSVRDLEIQLQTNRDRGQFSYYDVLLQNGRAFSISDRFSGVANGDSIYLYLENPSDSGFDYDVILNPRTGGMADLDISFGATQNDGTSITAQNLKSGSTRTFSGTAEKSTTSDSGTRPAHGTTFVEDIVPGGARGTRVGGAVIGGLSYTIDEGDNKLVELINQSGGSTRLSLNANVFETDGTFRSSDPN